MNPIAPVTWWHAAHASATAGPAWAKRVGVRLLAGEQADPAHRGRGAGKVLLHRAQGGERGPESTALADVVDGQLEGGLAEAGEVPDAGRDPGSRREPPHLNDIPEFEHPMHLDASRGRNRLGAEHRAAHDDAVLAREHHALGPQ